MNFLNKLKKQKPKKTTPIYIRQWSGLLPITPTSCKFTLKLRRISPGEDLALCGLLPGSDKVKYYMKLSGGPKSVWELLANRYPTHCLYFSYTVTNPSGKTNRILIGDSFSFEASGYDSNSVAKSCYKFILRVAHEVPDKKMLLFSKISQFTWTAAIYKIFAATIDFNYKSK